MKYNPVENESGFILVWSILLLVVLTLLGVAALTTSFFESIMASNEAVHKRTFYEADGGSENALSMLVENINCINSFKDLPNNEILTGGFVQLLDDSKANFWLTNSQRDLIDMPTLADMDFFYPANPSSAGTTNSPAGEPYTMVRINGRTQMMTGSNLPMLAGYEGKGKALGSDGAFLEYDIKAKHVGLRDSSTGIQTKFRLDNQFASFPAGNCVY